MNGWIRLLQFMYFFVALFVFTLGVSDRVGNILGIHKFDEVFTVVGALLLLPMILQIYAIIERYIPSIPVHHQTKVWTLGLRATLVIMYMLQEGLLLAYLVTYQGELNFLFLICDVLLLILMFTPTKWTTLWTTMYILSLSTKIALFWPKLDQSREMENEFAAKDNNLGPNGLLATMFFTIPVVQFPVLVSRVSTGVSVYEAFTTNMAAVLAHTLELLDALDMYFLGLERSSFSDDVQYLILIFAIMGMITSNLYYISLFFNDDTVERTLRRFQPADMSVFTADTGVDNEDLLHYLVWMCFFVDLPYSAMRFTAWCVHGTTVSVFFAKNLMMMCAVAALMVKHGADASRKRSANLNQTVTPLPDTPTATPAPPRPGTEISPVGSFIADADRHTPVAR